MSTFTWPSTSSNGVPIYPTFSAFPPGAAAGDLAVAADTGDLYEWNGSAWVLLATPSTPFTVGTIDSTTPSTNGAVITGSQLIMQSASASDPGLMNLTTQSFAGNKTFTGTISAFNLSGTNTGDVTLGTPNGLSLSSQVLSLALSSTSTVGALSAADWNTFNGKQAAGNYITALTGDGTATGPGSAGFTLATVNTNTGAFGSATAVGSFTVNGKGLISAASNISIQIAESQVTNLVSDLAGKQAVGNYITALTGQVTATGPGSVASTIATNTVTNSNLAQMATLTLKGNNTGSTANAADLTVSQVNTMLGTLNNPMTTQGDIIYENATPAPARLAIGTTGQVLTVASGLPSWASHTAPTISIVTTSSHSGGFSANGSGTYTTPAGVLYLEVMQVGGGGGGGAAGSASGGEAGGGGGGGGGYAYSLISSPSSTYSYTIGAGGTGGLVGSTAATAGGAATFGSNTAAGGGAGSASTGVDAPGAGGAGGLLTAGSATYFIPGGTGASGTFGISAVTQGLGGAGGASGLSPGGASSFSTGGAGNGFGAGGAGGAQAGGGAGGGGVIIVKEYYQ